MSERRYCPMCLRFDVISPASKDIKRKDIISVSTEKLGRVIKKAIEVGLIEKEVNIDQYTRNYHMLKEVVQEALK